MDYELVFDAGQKWPQVAFILPGVLFMVIGAVFWRYWDAPWLRRWNTNLVVQGRRVRVFGAVFFVFALLWTTAASVGVLGEYFDLRNALRSGDAQVVAGVIENFDPMPRSGHKLERFTVNGVPFAYSDFVMSGGFNQTRSHGGPLHAGLQVRLTYLPQGENNIILKVEVAKPPHSAVGDGNEG